MEIFKHVNKYVFFEKRMDTWTNTIVEIIKAIVKKKRTLTFYTLHTLFA
jgi:hypothetical protein